MNPVQWVTSVNEIQSRTMSSQTKNGGEENTLDWDENKHNRERGNDDDVKVVNMSASSIKIRCTWSI